VIHVSIHGGKWSLYLCNVLYMGTTILTAHMDANVPLTINSL
jgi:hypothetical protein